jgi:hypothetical protein
MLVGLLLLGLGLLAWPQARDAIADRLGLRGLTIIHVQEQPTPAPTPAGAGLGLGSAIGIAEAGAQLGQAVLIPQGLGPPDGVYARVGQVSLVYAPRDGLPAVQAAGGVGLLLTELRASVIDPAMSLGKGLPPGTHLEEVQVNGNRGYWIEGALHLFVRDPSGAIADAPPRLAANTLVWEQDAITLRMESGLQRDEAIRIGESVR